MPETASPRTLHARELFAPIAPTYDRYARLLSFGQDGRWRRFLVSRVEAGIDDVVLDVACGTGAVACELARSRGCSVVGVDPSEPMLRVGRDRVERAGLAERVRLVAGRAEALPFDDAAFDALTVTYLLRYVDDPAATLRELARVVRPGGTVASLEFGVPPRLPFRVLWELYVRVGLPALGALAPRGWRQVGGFLGASIRALYRSYPLETQLQLWREAGIADVQSRRLSLGGGLVVWGRRG